MRGLCLSPVCVPCLQPRALLGVVAAPAPKGFLFEAELLQDALHVQLARRVEAQQVGVRQGALWSSCSVRWLLRQAASATTDVAADKLSVPAAVSGRLRGWDA